MMKYVLVASVLVFLFVLMLFGLAHTFQPANLVYGIFLVCTYPALSCLFHLLVWDEIWLAFRYCSSNRIIFCVKGMSGLINHSIGSDDQRTFMVNSKSGSLIHGRGSSCLFDMNNRRLCLDFIKADDWERSCVGTEILLKGKSGVLGFGALSYEILDFGCTGY